MFFRNTCIRFPEVGWNSTYLYFWRSALRSNSLVRRVFLSISLNIRTLAQISQLKQNKSLEDHLNSGFKYLIFSISLCYEMNCFEPISHEPNHKWYYQHANLPHHESYARLHYIKLNRVDRDDKASNWISSILNDSLEAISDFTSQMKSNIFIKSRGKIRYNAFKLYDIT